MAHRLLHWLKARRGTWFVCVTQGFGLGSALAAGAIWWAAFFALSMGWTIGNLITRDDDTDVAPETKQRLKLQRAHVDHLFTPWVIVPAPIRDYMYPYDMQQRSCEICHYTERRHLGDRP